MLDRIYSDPSAAQDAATKLKMQGCYRVIITPRNGKNGREYVLQSWRLD